LHTGYKLPFGLFFPSMYEIRMDGYVREDDDEPNPDDTIADFHDKDISPNDITSPKRYEYWGDDGYRHLSHYTIPYINQRRLAEYELFGIFQFKGEDGNGDDIEPFGHFSVEIQSRTINANYVVWQVNRDTVRVRNNVFYTQPFVIRFQEEEDFLASTEKAVVLHGRVMEYDYVSNDSLGQYEGTTFTPLTLSMSTETHSFHGDDGVVQICLGLRRIGSAEEYQATYNGGEKSKHTEL